MENDALFKRASCGLALHGTYVGGRSEHTGSRRAPKQLLRPPEVCDLLKPDQPYKKESIFFSSIQEGNTFCEQLINSGWTVATNFSASFWGVGFGVGVSGGGGQGRVNEMNSKSSEVTSEACHMQYLYIPKASFRILRQQMRLTEEALDDIGRIHTPEEAVTFLSHYNSHLSTGIYHVGGVLLNGVTIKSLSETTLESLVEKISSKANGEAEASYMKVKGGVKVVYVNNKSSTSTSWWSSSSQKAEVRCAHTAIGPQTDDEDEFRTGLQDMSTWHIIDTSLTAELIPVWEIALMESNEGLRQACDLLREAWQTSVESVVDSKTGRVYELWCQSYQRARTNKVTCLLQELKTSSSPQTLHIQLSNLWLEASRRVKSDDFVQTSERLRLFQDADFQHLLSIIVESSDSDMDGAKISVHQLITDMQQLLPDKDVSLSQSVKNFMRSYAQKQINTDRLPPLEELSSSSGPLEHTTPKFKDDNVWTPLKEDVLLENIEVLPYNSFCTKNDLYTYNGDFLVDRPIAKSSEDPCKTMMDRVRHRQEPFAAMCNTIHETSNNDEDDDDDDYFGSNSSDDCCLSSSTIDHNRGIDSPLEILMQLLRRSDLLVQISMLQLLLEERCAVPLVIPCADDSSQFHQLVEALKFVQVKLANQENLTIAENISLLRVVFVSNRGVVSQRETADMACEVMNCQFPSKYLKNETSVGSTVLELGVGFLENAKEQPLEYVRSCLVFNVSGDHNKLGMILKEVADIVIIEMDLNEQPSKPSWTSSRNIPTRFWSISPSGRGRNRVYDHVWGNFKDITTGINQFLLKKIKAKEGLQRVNGGALTLVQCLSSLAPLNQETSTSSSEHLDAIQFDKVKPSLLLQRLYTEEAGYYFESLQKRGKAVELGQQMERCKENRARAASTIAKLPILQHFVQILREQSYVKRTISILHLQLAIDQKLEVMLHEATRKVNDAFEKTQKRPTDSTLKTRYNTAKRKHVDQMLGLEHLWRELSHIFVADSKRQAHLPKLAAYHLLDGHPLEILDGEATTFHNLWVDRVLVELNTQLNAILKREPKVFVLSVVGLQSSGKSTLLNVMFGTKLKASAGMCTRGVFLQLVKSEWPEFDYVLIVDTMGLRSPEFFGLKDSVAQDNRLATFAVLPADACVVMVANEEDNGLKDVLPMVMLAFKGSDLAEKYGRKIQAKLFFVYRSVDINDTKKLERNQRKLQVDLTEASLAIGSLNYCGTSDRVVTLESDGVSPLSDFQINTNDEKLSDVKYFGNVKKGTKPPGDTPDWEYGSKVEELREYIHERVLDAGRWKESTHKLVEWKDYLGMVWQSISEANFELSFLDHIEHASYQVMQTKLAMSRQKVGKKWQDEFERLTNNLQAIEENGDQPLVTLWNILRSRVDGTVKEEEVKVHNILEQKQCKKWKVAEIDRWNFDCSTNDNHWKCQLRDCIDGVLNFDKVVKDYTNKIQQEISEAGVKHHADVDSSDRKRRMFEDFEGIFKRILGQAEIKHPPMAKKVAGRIHNLYVNGAVVGEKFSFEDNKIELALSGQRVSLDNNKMELALVGQRVFLDNNKKDLGNISTIDMVWNAPNSIMQALKSLLKHFLIGRDEVASRFKLKNDGTEIQTLICKVQSYLEDAGSIPKDAVVEIQALISKVMSYLEDVKQYSDHLVQAMMELTRQSEKQFSRHVQHCMHKLVKALLTVQLTKVQEQWDSDHNVSKRLETQREYLWKQFQNHANKLDATNRLSMAFCDLLEQHHLVVTFEELITKFVSNKLHSEQWVCNWEVMRAYLDLHLIKLIETNQIDELLVCVSDGALLYEIVVGNFITREISKQLKDGYDSFAWTQLKDTICDSVRTAAFEAGHLNPESSLQRPLIFQKSIIKSLGHILPEISRLVSINVSEEVCSKYGDDIDFNQISNEVVEKVRRIRFNPTSSTDKVVDMVRTRMIQSKLDSIRPRCNAMCPRCHVTCLLSANHIGKHNALHQSEGLSGVGDYYKNELIWLSCAKCVELGWKMMPAKVSYKDHWMEHYPEWALPSNIMGMTKVREYIFANFQKELLQRYPDCKACRDIPPHFKLLNLEELRVELDSFILCRT